MSNVRSIAKNFIVLSIAQVISIVLSLVLVVLVTRFIGSEGYGKLGFAMSLASILTILTPMGLDQLMIREVARDKSVAAKYLGNVLVVELLLSILAFVFITAAVFILRLPGDSAAVLYISGGYCILTILSGAMKTIFRAHEKMEYDALLTSVRIIVTVAVGAAVLLLGWGLIALTFAYLAAAVVDLALTLAVTLKRFARPKLEFDFVFLKRIIPSALPFVVLSAVAVLYSQVDVIILRGMRGDAVVGWYRAAFVLASTFSVIPSILSSAIYPVLSRFHVSSGGSLKFTVEKSAKYLLVLGLPIATGIAMLAGPIISLFYGADFSPGVPALRVLALYVPFSFLNAVLGVMLVSMDKQRLRLFIYLASTVARIILNLFFIWKLSLTGAAVAIVGSEALLFGLNYYFGARHIPELNLFSLMWKPILAGMGMAAFIFAFRSWNLIIVIIIAAVVYFALFLAIRGFDHEDRSMLRDVWRGLRGE